MPDRNRKMIVEVESNNSDDIATTLRHIANQIEQGYTSGMDRNEDSSYVYSTTFQE
jgi:hypothetical protein